jgi:hypothetical protein
MGNQKEEVIKLFIKNNYKLLKEKEYFDVRIYNSIKKEFFGKKYQYKFGIPKDKEICNLLMEVIIKSQRIAEKEALTDIIEGSPFLKFNNIQVDDYVYLIDSLKNKYALTDGLQDYMGIERINKLTKLIEKEKIKEFDALIQQKKDEYRSLPSILDDIDFDEPQERNQETKKRNGGKSSISEKIHSPVPWTDSHKLVKHSTTTSSCPVSQ